MGRRVFIAVAAITAALALPAGAGATVGITTLVAQPVAPGGTCSTTPSAVDAPAGAHRDVCVAIAIDTASDDVRDLWAVDAGQSRFLVTGAGTEEEFRALIEAALTAAPLPAQS